MRCLQTADVMTCLIIEDDCVCQKVAVKMMRSAPTSPPPTHPCCLFSVSRADRRACAGGSKLGFKCETADNGLIGLNMLLDNPNRAQLVRASLNVPRCFVATEQ